MLALNIVFICKLLFRTMILAGCIRHQEPLDDSSWVDDSNCSSCSTALTWAVLNFFSSLPHDIGEVTIEEVFFTGGNAAFCKEGDTGSPLHVSGNWILEKLGGNAYVYQALLHVVHALRNHSNRSRLCVVFGDASFSSQLKLVIWVYIEFQVHFWWLSTCPHD